MTLPLWRRQAVHLSQEARSVNVRFLEQLRFQVRYLLWNGYCIALMVVGLVTLFVALSKNDDAFSIAALPGTAKALQAISGGFNWIATGFVVLFSGEIVHRESKVRFDGISKSLPIVQLSVVLSQAAALCWMVIVWQLIAMLGCFVFASFHGATLHIWDLLAGSTAAMLPVYLLTLWAFGLHYAVANKPVAFILVAGVAAVRGLAFEHADISYLLKPLALRQLSYSELIGFGDQWWAWSTVALYWTLASIAALSVLLLIAASRTNNKLLDIYPASLRKSCIAFGAPAAVGAMVVLGMLLWIDPHSRPGALQAKLSRDEAAYWQRYGSVDSQNQPDVHSVRMSIEFDPARAVVTVRGTIELQNHGNEPLRSMLVSGGSQSIRTVIDSAGAKVELRKGASALMQLSPEIPPGGSTFLRFESHIQGTPFDDDGGFGPVQHGFAFLNSMQILPCFGLNKSMNTGKWRTVKADQELPHSAAGSFLGCGFGLASMHLDMTAPADLVAVGPGDLVAEKTAGGITHATYEITAAPAMWGFGWGNWNVRSASLEGVTVKVLSWPGQAANAERILDEASKSLAYMQHWVSPYRYKRFTIVELPGPMTAPQSFVGLAGIPESVGFNADYGSHVALTPELARLDMPRWVVAHEISHQWWGLSVVPRDAPGWQFLTESLAEYSAWRQFELEGGENLDAVRRRASLEYNAARSQARWQEQALGQVDGQNYVAYAKGLLVMSAAEQLIGAQRLDETIADWLRSGASASQAQAATLIDRVIAAANETLRPYVRVLFLRRLTTRIDFEGASTRQSSPGVWTTSVCLRVTNSGNDLPEALAIPLKVALGRGRQLPVSRMVESGSAVSLSKSNQARVEVSSGFMPEWLTIDPTYLLLDPLHDDANRAISKQSVTRAPNKCEYQ